MFEINLVFLFNLEKIILNKVGLMAIALNKIRINIPKYKKKISKFN